MAVNQEELEIALCAFIKENIVAESIEIEPSTQLSDIGMDSFSTIEVVLYIERKFGIQLPDEVLTPDNISSVTALSKCSLELVTN